MIKRNLFYILLCLILPETTIGWAAPTPEVLQVYTELSPPYQTMQGNKVAGIATEKVRRLIRNAGISGEFLIYPWARALRYAQTNPNSLIYSIAKSPERDQYFEWLTPITYYKFGLVSLSNSTKLEIQNLGELKYYLISVQRDDISHQWALKQGLIEGKHFIVSPDIEYSWQLLLKGRVDYIIESSELMTSMLKQFKLDTNTTKYVLPIPELTITGYLAANKNIDSKVLSKLKASLTEPDIELLFNTKISKVDSD